MAEPVFLPLTSFYNIHPNSTGWIVGKGRTDFDYKDLSKIDGPAFFINDAVALEKHLRPDTPSYMMFLDYIQRAWLFQNLRSVILCPWEHQPNLQLWNNKVCVYHKNPHPIVTKRDPNLHALHVRAGTICTLIHFVWHTGVSKVKLIGCDGFNNSSRPAYDARIPSVSNGQPNWEYTKIRAAQEGVLFQLGLPYEYIGTPK